VLTLGGQTRTSLGVADRIGSHAVVRADSPATSESIISDTFLRFKGLERPFVIVTALAAAMDHRYDVRMHIALARATVGCVVVATGEQVIRMGGWWGWAESQPDSLVVGLSIATFGGVVSLERRDVEEVLSSPRAALVLEQRLTSDDP